MATNLENLQTAWQTQIALISDALIKAEATYLLDNYIAAVAKQAALEANEIQSYSIGGRSVTRRDPSAGQSIIHAMKTELYRYCYGGTALVDAMTEGAG